MGRSEPFPRALPLQCIPAYPPRIRQLADKEKKRGQGSGPPREALRAGDERRGSARRDEVIGRDVV